MMGLSLNLNVSLGRGLVDDGGAGLPPGAIGYADFKNGTYHYGGNALSDFIVENTAWGTFNPSTDVIAGVGLIGAPCLSPALFAAGWGSGIRITATLTSIDDGNDPGVFQIEGFDAPDYNEELWAKVFAGLPAPESAGVPYWFWVSALGNQVYGSTEVLRPSTDQLDVTFNASGSITAILNGETITSTGAGDASLINTVGIGAVPNLVCETMAVYLVN